MHTTHIHTTHTHTYVHTTHTHIAIYKYMGIPIATCEMVHTYGKYV